MKLNAFALSILSAGVLASGCATTAKGSSQSALMTGSAMQQLKTQAPAGGLLAVIRYPAVVDSAAKDAYRDAYTSSPIGGKISPATADSVEAQNMADSAIVKSNYFALSLYKEMAARLPEHTVLLSPHSVKLADDGSLTSEPITEAESLPSVVTIDFATYSFPDPKKMMNSEPLTFGDLVSPLVTVRTDHRAAVPTQGILLASQPLKSHAVGGNRKTVEKSLAQIEAGNLPTAIPEHDFISFISGDKQSSAPSQGLTLTGNSNAVQSYPVEKLQLNRTAMIQLNGDTQGIADPLKDIFSRPMADRIIDLINDTPVEKAAMMRRASAISQYDPSLAALTFVGSPKADYQSRYNYAQRLLDAERKYLSVQSLRLFDGIHNSEMGAQVRDMLTAEYGVLERRRELARKQNQATALAILGAVAAGASMGSSGSTERRCDRSGRCYEVQRPNYGQRILTETLINASIYAGTQAFAYRGESRAVGDNYLTSIVPALEQQTTVQVDLIDSNETITAIRFEDLREKLQTLYSENQRSLDTIATRCAYAHDGTTKSGTWLGECSGGMAAGSGVGVIRQANGTAIEYYGYTENGQPNGPGYMVVHNPSGSYSLEGNFNGGQANGTMRVSKPGKSDQIRTYKAGQDTGGASGTAKVMSPFDNRLAGS